jgi:hypothetical protein
MVEFQFFEGCPNSDTTRENLNELVREGIIQESEITITEIPSPEEAESRNFQGSPTILIDGIDIYNDQIPHGSSFSCRTYVFEGVRTGILSKEFIRAKYKEHRKPD